MAKAKVIRRESELLATLVGFTDTTLADNDPNKYPTDAVVTCTVIDSTGAVVAGGNALAMGYVAGTAGADTLYRGVIPSTLALVKAAHYWAKIRAVKGGSVGTFWVEFIAGPETAP
jgi:hypothetical protein